MTEKGSRSLKQSLKIHLNGQSAREKDFKDKIVRKSRISWPYKDHVSELAWYTNALGCYG